MPALPSVAALICTMTSDSLGLPFRMTSTSSVIIYLESNNSESR